MIHYRPLYYIPISTIPSWFNPMRFSWYPHLHKGYPNVSCRPCSPTSFSARFSKGTALFPASTRWSTNLRRCKNIDEHDPAQKGCLSDKKMPYHPWLIYLIFDGILYYTFEYIIYNTASRWKMPCSPMIDCFLSWSEKCVSKKNAFCYQQPRFVDLKTKVWGVLLGKNSVSLDRQLVWCFWSNKNREFTHFKAWKSCPNIVSKFLEGIECPKWWWLGTWGNTDFFVYGYELQPII